MDNSAPDAMMFFEQHPTVYPLYEAFQEKLLLRYPATRIKVQRSQILVLQPASLRLCVLFESKKTSGAAGKLFCADSGATCTVGIGAGRSQDRALSGTMDNPFCSPPYRRPGRGAV